MTAVPGVAVEQSRAAAIGEPGPGPVHIDGKPAAEVDQHHEVDEGPCLPGDEAGQPEGAKLRDGA